MEEHGSTVETKFHTTEDFWDCECELFYIHPAYKQECNTCFTNRHEDGAPDARMEEITEILEHAVQSRLMLRQFVVDLLALGFGEAEPVDGSEVVDLVNAYLPDLEKAARVQGG